MQNNNIRLAQIIDIQKIVELINLAYRSGHGWTHENEIVSGDRTSEAQLKELLAHSNFELFVLESQNQLIGCIGLTEFDEAIEIGSFAIDPLQQNSGRRRILLEFAEQYTQGKTLRMSVLNVRTELIAYYECCGYRLTGEIENYPLNKNVGKPLVDLNLVILEKNSS